MNRGVVGVSAVTFLAAAAAAVPPTRLIAVSSDFPPVLSWDASAPGPWAQVTQAPPGDFRIYSGAATDSLGNLYVSSLSPSPTGNTTRIEKLAAGTGELLGIFAEGFDEDLGEMAFTPGGDLLVLAGTSAGPSIRRYGPDGTPMGTAFSKSGFGIRCVRVGPDGRGYASLNSTSGEHEIAIFDPVTGVSHGSIQVPGSTNLGDFDFGPDGNIYGVRFRDQTVYRVAPVAGATPETAFLGRRSDPSELRGGKSADGDES